MKHRIAILSDIHSNWEALQAVLQEIDREGIDRILCCGDVVGYGPRPRECVRLLRERGIPTVMGNHDLYVTGLFRDPEYLPRVSGNQMVWAGVRHAVRELEEEDIVWLEALPMELHMPGAVVAHAALHDVGRWPYLTHAEEAEPTLRIQEGAGWKVGFFGHSHRQEWHSRPAGALREAGGGGWVLDDEAVCAVIVGSVGQPRTGDPRAAWTLWDPEAGTITFRRTHYPLQTTFREILHAGLPHRTAARLLVGS